jgi:ribosome recycling factor
MSYKPEVQPHFNSYEQKLEKVIAHLKTELSLVRAGRANPQILSKITVDYWGTPTPLMQMATVTVPEARMLLIKLFDNSALKDTEKAILASEIGINPTNDGSCLRLVFPQLNEEKRKELVKNSKKICEDSKIVLRNERRDILDTINTLKKDNIISEDEEKSYGVDVQKILDKHTETVDKMLKDKEAEILEVYNF